MMGNHFEYVQQVSRKLSIITSKGNNKTYELIDDSVLSVCSAMQTNKTHE
jgi:hypothetical protein